ncbi:hypothetical protein [Cellulomonas palmilytica]|uniref:hypothetical protein n=1 Tax=Cellulomonas palmilytica TaxID=2608402 RepID=UPI001F19E58E|nr:hypothetical protein [Cellulomonas palmilytica]UJP38690.1 DUF4439 domain-containing protein [Cellulomonas palmilytica]
MSTAISPDPSTSRVARITRARARRGTHAAVVGALLALALGGCGLRLETPPPVEPSPDALEQVRGRTVADALALEAAADGALTVTADEAVAPLLEQVADVSAQHAAALGGAYDSGIVDPDAEPTPTASPTTEATTAQDVLALLGTTSSTARTDASTTDDGPLARVVGSVAVARADLALRLALALGEDSPAPGVPDELVVPAEVDPAVGGPLARAHDEAGFALEVVAARGAKDVRATVLAQARGQRARAEQWATAAGVSGTGEETRLGQYALPADLDADGALTALVRDVHAGVGHAAAAALAQVPAGAREPYLDELRVAVERARVAGAPVQAFPGLPEQTDPEQTEPEQAEPAPTPTP